MHDITVSAEYEDALLGAILLDNRVLEEYAIQAQYFEAPRAQAVFRAIQSAIGKGCVANIVEIGRALPGQAEYIARLSDASISASNAKFYVDELQDKWKRREIIKLARQMGEMTHDVQNTAADILGACDRALLDIAMTSEKGYRHISEIVPRAIEEIEAAYAHRGALTGIDTGFPDLNRRTGGFQKQWFVVVGARPGAGKTAMALNMITAALKAGHRVGMFSAEMSAESITKRLFADWGNIDHRAMVTGYVAPGDLERIEEASARLVEQNLFINDMANIPLNELVSEAYRMKRREKIDIIFVDYLSLVSNKSHAPRHEQVAEISQTLKGLARGLDIPLIALSQLNRESQDERPKLSHLRDSGCLSGDTLVQCHKYRKAINTLDGEECFGVLSHQEDGGNMVKTGKKCFYTGKKETFEIKTTTGHAIRATGNHKFLVPGGRWARLDELGEGDLIGLYLGEPDDLEKTISDEMLKFLGLFIGNGCALPRRSIQYTSNSKDEDLCKEIIELSKTICGNYIRPYYKHAEYRAGTQGKSTAINVFFPSTRQVSRKYHNPLIAILKDYGLYGKRAKEKTIPIEVFIQPLKDRRLFLKYLWATDGTISYSDKKKKKIDISYSTSSEEMAYQVQALLQSIGIMASISKVKQREFTWFNVSIYSRYFRQKFMQEVGIAGNRKNSVLDYCMEKDMGTDAGWTAYELSDDKSICYVPIKSITAYGIEEVYDIEVPGTHNFMANGFIVHNSVEQDADMVLMLWNKGQAGKEEAKQAVTMITEKHRHGPKGDLDLIFHATRMRFYEVTEGLK